MNRQRHHTLLRGSETRIKTRDITGGQTSIRSPTSPSTLHPTPPRWAKLASGSNQNNFSVNTTVAFKVHHSNDIDSSQTPHRIPTLIYWAHRAPHRTGHWLQTSPWNHPWLQRRRYTPQCRAKSHSRTPQRLSSTTTSSTSKPNRRRDREAPTNSQHYTIKDWHFGVTLSKPSWRQVIELRRYLEHYRLVEPFHLASQNSPGRMDQRIP